MPEAGRTYQKMVRSQMVKRTVKRPMIILNMGGRSEDVPVLEVFVDAGLVIRLDGLVGAVGGDSVDNCVTTDILRSHSTYTMGDIRMPRDMVVHL